MSGIDDIMEEILWHIDGTEADIEFYGEDTYKGEEAKRVVDILKQVYDLLKKI